MRTTELQKRIIELAFLKHSEAPLVSCYVNAGSACRSFLKERIAVMETEFSPEQRAYFGRAAAKIDSYLAVGLDRSSRGIAMFSRAGARPFFLALPLAVPVTQFVAAGALPVIYPLMEVQHKYEPFLVAICGKAETRIIGIDLGRVVSETLAKGCLIARARILQQAVSSSGYGPVVLAGAHVETAALAAAFPPRMATVIFGTMVCRLDAHSTKIIEAARGVRKVFARSNLWS